MPEGGRKLPPATLPWPQRPGRQGSRPGGSAPGAAQHQPKQECVAATSTSPIGQVRWQPARTVQSGRRHRAFSSNDVRPSQTIPVLGLAGVVGPRGWIPERHHRIEVAMAPVLVHPSRVGRANPGRVNSLSLRAKRRNLGPAGHSDGDCRVAALLAMTGQSTAISGWPAGHPEQATV
jgi:hypothetical protein